MRPLILCILISCFTEFIMEIYVHVNTLMYCNKTTYNNIEGHTLGHILFT